MIGNRIQNLIRQKRININQVAEKLNITKQQIYNIFKKEHIDTSYLFQFAEILDISPEFLLVGDKEGNFETRAVKDLKNEVESLKKRITELEEQLNDKSQIIEFAKKENLFAYANLISALMWTRSEKDGSINAEQLNDWTRSKISDPAFLQKLLDQGLIRDFDYLFLSKWIKKKESSHPTATRPPTSAL